MRILEFSFPLVHGSGKSAFLVTKSSLSRRFSGIAAEFKITRGLFFLGLLLWIIFEMSSFPVPLSPVISTVAVVPEI